LKGPDLEALYDTMRDQFSALPGVESVASVPFPILVELVIGTNVAVVGDAQEIADGSANLNPMVSPGFFRTLSIPLLAGRDFADDDTRTNPNVVIVNESFVRKFHLGPNPVGKTLRLTGRYVPRESVEVIGVVADALHTSAKGSAGPQVYTTRPRGDMTFSSRAHYVRASGDPSSLADMLRRTM